MIGRIVVTAKIPLTEFAGVDHLPAFLGRQFVFMTHLTFFWVQFCLTVSPGTSIDKTIPDNLALVHTGDDLVDILQQGVSPSFLSLFP